MNSCLTCGVSTKNVKYCNGTCQQQHRYEKFISLWKQGNVSGGTVHRVSWYVRRYLLETRGNECERCGWNKINPITKTVPIEIHHKNGNEDHSEENLELLCPNCHSLTPTYRNLNKGKGRKYRLGSVAQFSRAPV